VFLHWVSSSCSYASKFLCVSVCLSMCRHVCVSICVCQTVVAILRRDDGGLGFSVAGGKGTMPYRVDDEVCSFSFI